MAFKIKLKSWKHNVVLVDVRTPNFCFFIWHSCMYAVFWVPLVHSISLVGLFFGSSIGGHPGNVACKVLFERRFYFHGVDYVCFRIHWIVFLSLKEKPIKIPHQSGWIIRWRQLFRLKWIKLNKLETAVFGNLNHFRFY